MWQRDARICTAKAGFCRSGDTSPSSFVPPMRYFSSKYTKYSIEKISFWDAKLLAECSCRMLSCCRFFGNIIR